MTPLPPHGAYVICERPQTGWQNKFIKSLQKTEEVPTTWLVGTLCNLEVVVEASLFLIIVKNRLPHKIAFSSYFSVLYTLGMQNFRNEIISISKDNFPKDKLDKNFCQNNCS